MVVVMVVSDDDRVCMGEFTPISSPTFVNNQPPIRTIDSG
jgi:hypothetical protein